MRKEHAKHNEAACNYLIESGEFNDWVVTTAFYSALHYLQHELFPLEYKNATYGNFNDYCNSLSNVINEKPSRHNEQIKLVGMRLPNCNKFYRWLFDECMKARYNNYKVSDSVAKQAKKTLNNIKQQLNKA